MKTNFDDKHLDSQRYHSLKDPSEKKADKKGSLFNRVKKSEYLDEESKSSELTTFSQNNEFAD